MHKQQQADKKMQIEAIQKGSGKELKGINNYLKQAQTQEFIDFMAKEYSSADVVEKPSKLAEANKRRLSKSLIAGRELDIRNLSLEAQKENDSVI